MKLWGGGKRGTGGRESNRDIPEQSTVLRPRYRQIKNIRNDGVTVDDQARPLCEVREDEARVDEPPERDLCKRIRERSLYVYQLFAFPYFIVTPPRGGGRGGGVDGPG